MIFNVKNIIPFVIILTVIFGSVGYLLFVGGVHHSHLMCPISILWKNSCPPTMNSLLFLEHHLSGWQSLVSATENFGPYIFLILSILFLTVAYVNLTRRAQLLKQAQYFFPPKESIKFKFLANKEYLAWLVGIQTLKPFTVFRAHT